MSRPLRKLANRFALAWGWLLLLGLRALVRVEYEGRQHFLGLKREGASVLIAVWHGRILLPILVHRNEGIVPLISLSRDGEMISRTVEKLGYRSVRGSSSKRSQEALAEMIAALSVPGTVGAIMPDGPRGPRHSMKSGVIRMARESGAVILPMSFRAKRPLEFRSWDRFNAWKPLTRAIVVYGEPIRLDPEGDFAVQREAVRQALIAVEQRADRWYTATPPGDPIRG
jgi:lysophospholipid acyltransferase (LPLAT)-like uncharacterized protein